MNITITVFTSFTLYIAATTAGAVTASPTTAPSSQMGVDFTVRPAAAPDPALKYRLKPALFELTRGNAAPLYLMAFLQLHLTEGEQKQVAGLLAAPRDQFSVDEAKRIVKSREVYFVALDLAARRDRCHWDIPFREQGVATLLPHLQPCRDAVRLMALRARVNTAEGHFDDTVHALQTGFALVEHLKDDAMLVQGLVAIAMSNMLLDQIVEFEQTPGAPNLYWALADLPRPVANMRAMAEMERSWFWSILPDLKGRTARELSSDEYKMAVSRLRNLLSLIDAEEKGIRNQLEAAGVMAMAVGPARAWLVSHGYTEQQVAQMPMEQSIGIYFIESYTQIADELFKWTLLPYWQAREGIVRSEEQFRRDKMRSANPLLMLLPVTGRAYAQISRIDRRLAMLQTVEALRGYAAVHEGKLPASLGDLTEMPALIDPMTGKAFEYRVEGGTAVLGTPEVEGPIYRIRCGG